MVLHRKYQHLNRHELRITYFHFPRLVLLSMKPTRKSSLDCAIFGHNYVINESPNLSNSKYVCKHCNKPLEVNKKGDVIEDSISNKDIQNTLRQLYLLNVNKPKLSF